MSALVIMVVVRGVRTQLVHTSVLVQLATSYNPTNAHVKVVIHSCHCFNSDFFSLFHLLLSTILHLIVSAFLHSSYRY